MKNAILLLTFLSFFGISYGQICDPDTTITEQGIYPDSLDRAVVGTPYEQVLQILAFRDTTVVVANNPIAVKVDSIIIDTIEGLPSTFTYGCVPGNCLYTYLDVGCAKLSGDPIAADIGEHPLLIMVTTYAKWGSIALDAQDTLKDFTLVVVDSNLMSIQDISKSIIISPNPVLGNSLEVLSSKAMSAIEIMDQQGKVILTINIDHSLSEIVDIQDVPKGVYYIRLHTDQGIYTKKLMRLE